MDDLQSRVYRVFYDELYECYLQKEHHGILPASARGKRSPSLWTAIPKGKKESPAIKLFGGGVTSDPSYFHKKYLELNPRKVKEGMIDDLAYYKGLDYLKFYTPDDEKAWQKKSWRLQLPILHRAFIIQYVPEALTDDFEEEPSHFDIPKGKLYKLLEALKAEAKGLGKSEQTELYKALKHEILKIFRTAEEAFPVLNEETHLPILALETDEDILAYRLSPEEKERLYQFIFDDTNSKVIRKKALRVFCLHKGLTDAQIIQLIKSPEQGISRLALDELPNLVSGGNNTDYICAEVIAYASLSKDVGVPRRICEQGLKVNFEVMVQELAKFFPTRDIGIPTRILTSLIEYLSANPETIQTLDLLSQTENLVDLSENHNPTHAQIQPKCEALRAMFQEIRNQNNWINS